MEIPECPGCLAAQARIAELEAKVLRLEAKVVEYEGIIRDLIEKLNQFTKPPVEPRGHEPLPKGPPKKATGRRRGGQQGHPPKLKERLPPDRITKTIPFVPEQCSKCQTSLPNEAGPNDPPATWHQVAELPKIAAEITEYQGHYRTCPCCGEVNHATIPASVRADSIGPNLAAAMSYFAGCQGVSKRGIEEIVEAMFQVPVSLGTIANLEQEMSESLQPAHQEARQAVADSSVKYVDETGWKQAGKKRWLWVAATLQAVVFAIHSRRNWDALEHLLGKINGMIVTDRWSVYNQWQDDSHQVCWAHVMRNWEKKAERGGKAKELADRWLADQRRVFDLWYRFRGGGISWEKLNEGMQPLIESMRTILNAGMRSGDRTLVRFCTRLSDHYQKLWLFVLEQGVEPTNNHAERVLRRPVLWRRRSFGCDSAAGCRFVERILTVVQTLRLTKRSVLEFLSAAIKARREGTPSPKLLAEIG